MNDSLTQIQTICQHGIALAAAATPGPWHEPTIYSGIRHLDRNVDWYYDNLPEDQQAPGAGREKDAAFIAHSRTLLPALATALQEATEALRIVSESGIAADSTVNVMLLSAHKRHSAEVLARIAASLTEAQTP